MLPCTLVKYLVNCTAYEETAWCYVPHCLKPLRYFCTSLHNTCALSAECIFFNQTIWLLCSVPFAYDCFLYLLAICFVLTCFIILKIVLIALFLCLIFGRNYGYDWPDTIQIKWSVCHSIGVNLIA